MRAIFRSQTRAVSQEAMKWPSWLPRVLTEPPPVPVLEATRRTRITTPSAEKVGIRDVGMCEACGRRMQARTRREAFRGRVDCDCGHHNHVEFRDVRTLNGIEQRHVAVTTGYHVESATQDLHLPWRYGICPSCTMATSLSDAHVLSHEDAGGVETFAYYCTGCFVADEVHRGRLMGHDGIQVIDTLHHEIPGGVR